MKKLFCTLFCVMAFSQNALADDKSEVAALVKTRIDAVVALLQQKDLDKEIRNDRIIETLTPIFDFNIMAKLSLGKKYWPGLSEEKQKEFSDLFIKRLQESYLEKLDLYSDEKVVYNEPTPVGKKMHILTHLVSPDDKIDMLYKLYQTGEGWKVYDVEIQGVSVIQTYRSQFDGVLKDGTIADLLARLEKKGEFIIPAGNK